MRSERARPGVFYHSNEANNNNNNNNNNSHLHGNCFVNEHVDVELLFARRVALHLLDHVDEALLPHLFVACARVRVRSKRVLNVGKRGSVHSQNYFLPNSAPLLPAREKLNENSPETSP